MNLHRLLQQRLAAGQPVRVGLIGAGKFGSMFLAQVPTTPGIEVAAIADLAPDRAKDACRRVGWNSARIEATRFTDDAWPCCSPRRTWRSWWKPPATRPPASPTPAARSPTASTSSW